MTSSPLHQDGDCSAGMSIRHRKTACSKALILEPHFAQSGFWLPRLTVTAYVLVKSWFAASLPCTRLCELRLLLHKNIFTLQKLALSSLFPRAMGCRVCHVHLTQLRGPRWRLDGFEKGSCMYWWVVFFFTRGRQGISGRPCSFHSRNDQDSARKAKSSTYCANDQASRK